MKNLGLKDFSRRISSAWNRESHSHRYALVLIFLTGILVRLAFLFQPICHDEAITYMYLASNPLSKLLTIYPDPNHHIFHTLLVHFNTMVLGNDPWVIRLPAFFAGVLIIPATYLVIRKLFNKNAAIIATALVVPSSQLIIYSTNARGYTIQALIFLILLLLAIYIKKTDRLSGWIGLVLFSVIGFYTIPTMLYFFLSVIIWLFLSAVYRDTCTSRTVFIKKLAVAFVLVLFIVVLLYLPPAINSGLSNIIANPWVKSLSWSTFIQLFPGNMKTTWTAWNTDIPLFMTILLVACFLLSILFYKRIARHRINLALVVLGLCLPLLLIQRVLPPARIWLPLLPLSLGYCAAGFYYVWKISIDFLKKKGVRTTIFGPAFSTVLVVVISICLCLLVVVSQSPYQPSEQVTLRDAEKIALWFQSRLEPGDIVYIQQNIRIPLEYYFFKHGIPLEYLCRYPEDIEKQYPSIKRAFIIEAEKEGYPLSVSMKHSNLEPNKNYTLSPGIEFPYSSVLIIYEPTLLKP